MMEAVSAPAVAVGDSQLPNVAVVSSVVRKKKRKVGILVLKKSVKHAVVQTVAALPGTFHRLAEQESIVMDKPWSVGWVDNCDRATYNKMKPHQKVNHMPGVEQITRKKALGRSV
jgi:hypothetical protein